jgi:type IV pilus assembly protein PilC
MPRFAYSAMDGRGTPCAGQVEAAHADAAVAALRERGLFPLELSPVSGEAVATAPDRHGSAKPSGRWQDIEIRLPFMAPVGVRERAVFTRQVSTLLRAGMPLLRGLEVLGRQEKNRVLRGVIEATADDIRAGRKFSEALARHPAVFDRLFVNMVRAGEAGGVLEVVLERLARFQEKSLQLRGKVKAALAYPIVVLAVATLILVGLLVFVVPKFEQIFADLLKGAPLPPLTQAVLAVSDVVRGHFLWVVLIACGLVWAFRVYRRRPAGAQRVDGWLIRVPLFGDLLLKSLVARFARTLGTLLASGVPILPAILITRDTTGNACLAAALEVVHDRVKAGEPVAAPLAATAVFPAMVTSMIEVGEHTGKLAEMLQKVADIYEEEVDAAVAGLSSLIEPILIVVLAGVVGTIVIALFLPIVRIVQLLS